ncbi:MAG: Sensor protein kinase WalK [Pelotomaculum sp. PtaB.Bin013]|uniref:histidine kinase n=1 Tax=Pelotomaculum isophthalicicum JI TaxID=947010 RepID=A0A9X4JVN8_9FIRM|nr:HAMP domain-containing sensor histidine kinase [Pelotomaculum isophthalicicum]MDF9407722.1 HAMP domain-containing histidine kinase [Pelotomaculum isophthalicicum JI]OPX89219.1 MAG: Sensor protein kinase WalK [Pelotomaculum sp. PtaB.Bin013]
MSLKTKIWGSCIIMVTVPLLLSILSASLIRINYEKDHQIQIIEAAQEETMRETTGFMDELENTLVNKPDYFKDPFYLAQFNEKISSLNMGVMVQCNGDFIYNSVPVNTEKIKPNLSKFIQQDVTGKWVSATTKDYIVRCRAFSFSDGTTGQIYLFMNRIPPWEASPADHIAYVKWVFFIFIICIFLTNSYLTYLLYKSLIEPLNLVKKAAKEIQHGNLDYPISYPVNNEIGELYQDFEEMRLKLKQSQELNTQYEKSRKELISNISHDLKTPITAIKGYAQGIIEGVANNPEKVGKYLRTIIAHAVEMERLANDLALFSKLDIKQLPFSFECIEINRYLEDAREELNFDLSENNIILKFESHYKSNDLIMADRQRLIRVIHNIVENAKKHLNKQEKEIKIILKEEESSALIEIRDNGSGIPADKLPLIFNRFYRVDSSRNRTTGGGGIGLSIAREIIEAHQGRIWAESTEDLGTSIFFTLIKAAYFKNK